MKSKIIMAIMFAIASTCSPSISFAQPGPVENPDAPADIPIDGGLSLLLAAGVGLGVKKISDSRKKSLQKNNDVSVK